MDLGVPDCAEALLDRAEELVGERRAALVEDLEVVLGWADLHSAEPGVRIEGGDRLVRLGGEGTPSVRDLCLEELSIARHVHLNATRAAMADALDLRHRLPRLWAAVQGLRIEPWVARKVAATSRGLDRAAVAHVDQVVSGVVAQSPSRVLDAAEQAIAEADVEAHRSQVEQAKALKGVWVARSREELPGLRSVFARIDAADAVWVDATVQRVADLLSADPGLREEHHPELGQAPSADELRAAAFGWLARPGDLAELLGILEEAPQSGVARRPDAVVYVHLEQEALPDDPVAREERLGPLLVEQVTKLVGHAQVILKPVIDLNRATAVDGYDHPAAVRERTQLRMAGDGFPYATSRSRRWDADHVTPYDPDGPPGQTGDLNIAPLGRHSHRAKTHLGYEVEQVGLASYRWRTPHGLERTVDARGTHAPDRPIDILADAVFRWKLEYAS